ncbi:MAG: patatin-like phospholipase family protein, partial [Bacteroidetes bacterium]|nr:patatin-like phospholipase family protein [Bacteroidota bacterium]
MNNQKNIFLFLLIFVFLVSAQTTFSQKFTFEVKTRIKTLPFGLEQKIPLNKLIIGVALSGGGARGFAQVGVLKALQEERINIDIITATSMGSIVGGLYSMGYSIDEIDSIVKKTDWEDLLIINRKPNRRDLYINQKITEDKAIFSLRLDGFKPIIPTSLNNGEKISNFLNLLSIKAPLHVDKTFDELYTKFRTICTDLISGKMVILKSGSISQAMRASSSVSFLLSPIKQDSLMLVDGGLVANIPVSIAKSIGADFIFAVNTTSRLHKKEELDLPWVIADQIISIPMKILNDEQLKNANIVITPQLNNHLATDFNNIESIITRGYNAAKQKITGIKKHLDSLSARKQIDSVVYFKKLTIGKNATNLERLFYHKLSNTKNFTNLDLILYLNSVFSTGDYKDITSEIDITNEGLTTLKIYANKNTTINKITVKGANKKDTKYIEQSLSKLIGNPYNVKKLLYKLLDISRHYRNKGFVFTEVKDINFNYNNGSLYIRIDERKISGIKITGNTITNKEIILREFNLDEKGILSFEDLKRGLNNLRNTNLFENIVITHIYKEEGSFLNIKLNDKPSSLLRFGFRLDNENKSQISFNIRDDNLMGTGTELGFLVSFSNRIKSYMLEHRANRIFNTYLTYSVNLFYKFNDIFSYQDDPKISETKFSRSITGEYRQIFYGASVTVGTQVKKFGNVTLTGKYELNEIKNKSGNSVTPNKDKLVSFKLQSIIDTQDKYPYPTKGIYFNGYYETGQSILGSDISYIKAAFEYKNYFSFGSSHTIVPKVKIGFGDNTLPLSQQYSIGGQNDFFGMRDDEFRGRQVFLSSFGYRYKLPVKIFFPTYFKLRYDIGAVWEFPNQIRF